MVYRSADERFRRLFFQRHQRGFVEGKFQTAAAGMERTGYHPLISASFAQCRNRRPQTRSVVFSNGGFLHSVPAGSFFRRLPATPKNTPVKRNFFTIAIHCKHGCFNNETNTTHAIRQKSADNGCTPIATDPDKTALSNHRVSLNPAVLSFFAAALPADVFRTGLLTKNRQPKHVFNGSRRRFPFFAAVLPAGIFRTGL